MKRLISLCLSEVMDEVSCLGIRYLSRTTIFGKTPIEIFEVMQSMSSGGLIKRPESLKTHTLTDRYCYTLIDPKGHTAPT
jgi:hypothetical protein